MSTLSTQPTADLARAHTAHRGNAHLIAFSGKMASGKDTAFDITLDLLGIREQHEHHAFADPLKNELDAIIGTIREFFPAAGYSPSDRFARAALAATLATIHEIPMGDAVEHFAGQFAVDVLANPNLHARSRSQEVRRALQALGTDIWRNIDPDHWVNLAKEPMKAALAEGQSVLLTDARFPNEVDATLAMGGVVIRLDVSEATQRQRLMDRDGLELDSDKASHPSETALDTYDRFSARVSNDGSLEELRLSLAGAITSLLV